MRNACIPFVRITAMTVWLITGALLLGGCSRNPVTGKKEFNLMSEGQELALGQQSDPEILAEFGVYNDERLQRFITEKGKAMAAISHRPDLNYQFKVLDSPVVNAFALPGGYVYFTRGILAHFNNEAQFAGVLGHEIGHVTARHSARQYSRTMLAQLGLIAGIVIKPELAQFADVASQGIGLLLLKYGRDAETESDRLGVEYSTKINYDAHEMAGFFTTLGRLSGDEGERLPTFLSTHPDPGDRERNVGTLAGEWQRRESGRSYQVNRDSYLRMIDGLIYGEDPRQGYVENNAFYHPELKFQFPTPAQWQVVNSPQQVQMAPEDGKALMTLTLARGSTLTEAAQQTLQQYKLTLSGQREQRVNGLDALEMTADLVQEGQDAQGRTVRQVVRTISYYIRYNNLIYHFMGLAMEADFEANRPRFLSTMTGFRELTDAAKINRQPEKIKIQTLAQDMTLQDALRTYGISSDRYREMAVLNGMELTTRLTRGTIIKTVQR